MNVTAKKTARSSGSASLLKQIVKGIESRPSSGMVWGQSGVGKSSTIGWIPGVVIMRFSDEDPWASLKRSGIVPKDLAILPVVSSWPMVMLVLQELLDEDHDYKAIAIDTIGSLEKLCHKHVTERDYNGDATDRGFLRYMVGYESSLVEWRLMLSALDALRDQKQMSVVFTGHSKTKPHRDPLLPDYDRHVVDIHDKTWNVTHRWLDWCFFMNRIVDVVTEENRSKGRSDGSRVFHTDWSAGYDAKNRFNIREDLDAGDNGKEAWSNIMEAIKKARQS